MTVLADYSAEEQELIRHAVASAAIAVSAASLGRNEETVSEGFAAADLVLKSQPNFVGNTLVTSIIVQVDAEVQTDQVFPDYLQRVSAPGAYDESLIVEETIEIPVQIKGKLRSRIRVPAEATDQEMEAAARADERIAELLADRQIVKVIVVPGRMVNFVVKG